jgi:hypothetical protein
MHYRGHEAKNRIVSLLLFHSGTSGLTYQFFHQEYKPMRLRIAVRLARYFLRIKVMVDSTYMPVWKLISGPHGHFSLPPRQVSLVCLQLKFYLFLA